MAGSPSKSIPASVSRLQDNFTSPPNPDDKIAVIYQDELRRRSFNYSSVIQLSDAIFESINSIVKSDDAEGGAGVEFIGVSCAQDVYYPSVLLGILRSGHAFYCMDTQSEFQCQQRPIHILDINYMLVDASWIELQLSSWQKNNELKVEVVWTMAVIPAVQTSLHVEANHIDADCDQRKLFILKLSPLNPGSDSNSTKSSTGPPKLCAEKDSNWAYAIRTSGTTGSRKVVLVPHACICPNLNSLQAEFKLSSNDVLFGCAPTTFDPNIVDLFLALRNSATILYVSPSIKLNPAKLADVLHSNQVSFMQITPSIYYRFNLEEKAKLCCAAESHVKLIVFGGEKLVDERELRFLLASNRCSIYNIYGTTEVSCWASLAKVDESNANKVPIGKSLDDTEVKLFNTQIEPEIGIGSKTRITTVLRECNGQAIKPMMYDGVTFRLTGDSGLYLRNGAGILFNGRFDRVVKRNGYFNDLVFIEDQLMKSGRFSFVHAFQYLGKIYALYKPCIPRNSIGVNEHTPQEDGSSPNRRSANNRRSIMDLFNCSFPFHSYPDRLIELEPTEVIPISENGKLDETFLMKAVLNEELLSTTQKTSISVNYDREEVEGMLVTFWMRCTNTGASRQEKERNGQSQPAPPSDSSMFFEVGGNSMSAVMFVELVMQMCSARGTADALRQEKELLDVLRRKPFGTVKTRVYEQVCQAHPYCIEQFSLRSISRNKAPSNSIDKWLEPESSTTSYSSVKTLAVEQIGSTKHWGVTLFGCVDTTVTILKTEIPRGGGDRVPEVKATLAVVGAHSGVVAAIDLDTFASHSSGRPGESRPVVWAKLFPDRIAAGVAVSLDNEYIFIPCCDCVIYCAASATGRIKWAHRGSAMFKATPVPLPTQPPKLLVVSDDAVLTCLDIWNGQVHWTLQPSFRIATTLKPVFIDNEIIAIADNAVFLKIDTLTTELTEVKQETSSCCTDLVAFTSPRGSFLMYGTVFGGIIVLKKDLTKFWMNSCGPPVAVNTPVYHSCDVHEPMIAYTTHQGRFICLDIRGAPLLSLQMESHIHSPPVFYSRSGKDGQPQSRSCLPAVIDMQSSILLLDLNEEKLARKLENATPAECFSTPILHGDHLLWGSRDNYLHVSDLSV